MNKNLQLTIFSIIAIFLILALVGWSLITKLIFAKIENGQICSDISDSQIAMIKLAIVAIWMITVTMIIFYAKNITSLSDFFGREKCPLTMHLSGLIGAMFTMQSLGLAYITMMVFNIKKNNAGRYCYNTTKVDNLIARVAFILSTLAIFGAIVESSRLFFIAYKEPAAPTLRPRRKPRSVSISRPAPALELIAV